MSSLERRVDAAEGTPVPFLGVISDNHPHSLGLSIEGAVPDGTPTPLDTFTARLNIFSPLEKHNGYVPLDADTFLPHLWNAADPMLRMMGRVAEISFAGAKSPTGVVHNIQTDVFDVHVAQGSVFFGLIDYARDKARKKEEIEFPYADSDFEYGKDMGDIDSVWRHHSYKDPDTDEAVHTYEHVWSGSDLYPMDSELPIFYAENTHPRAGEESGVVSLRYGIDDDFIQITKKYLTEYGKEPDIAGLTEELIVAYARAKKANNPKTRDLFAEEFFTKLDERFPLSHARETVNPVLRVFQEIDRLGLVDRKASRAQREKARRMIERACWKTSAFQLSLEGHSFTQTMFDDVTGEEYDLKWKLLARMGVLDANDKSSRITSLLTSKLSNAQKRQQHGAFYILQEGGPKGPLGPFQFGVPGGQVKPLESGEVVIPVGQPVPHESFVHFSDVIEELETPQAGMTKMLKLAGAHVVRIHQLNGIWEELLVTSARNTHGRIGEWIVGEHNPYTHKFQQHRDPGSKTYLSDVLRGHRTGITSPLYAIGQRVRTARSIDPFVVKGYATTERPYATTVNPDDVKQLPAALVGQIVSRKRELAIRKDSSARTSGALAILGDHELDAHTPKFTPQRGHHTVFSLRVHPRGGPLVSAHTSTDPTNPLPNVKVVVPAHFAPRQRFDRGSNNRRRSGRNGRR